MLRIGFRVRISDRFRALGFKERDKFRVRIRVWEWSGVTMLALLTVSLYVLR